MSDQVRRPGTPQGAPQATPQGKPQATPQGRTQRVASGAASPRAQATAAKAVPIAAAATAQRPLQAAAAATGHAPTRVAIRGTRPADLIEPVRAKAPAGGSWTEYLVLFLRVMAAVSLIKGLYHWAQICSIGASANQAFDMQSMAWRSVTVFFAVIDLVAAVGLWLAAAWGAVVWLTSVVSMAMVELFFPSVYGGSAFVVLTEIALLGVYLWLAIVSARERPA
jgi:Family of unknown function (DUF6163)